MQFIQIEISGKVQGVFFRKNTKVVADKLGIKGWVKNLESGGVLIEAQASAEEMAKFIEWCKRGPEASRVEKIDVKELTKPSNNFTSFEILR